jgi:hypothetical protein
MGETMEAVYGHNYGTVSEHRLGSQFTEWAVNKQFVLGDELSLGDKRHTTNILKDMITRRELPINIKSKRSYTVRDHINYYLTSNYADAVYLEPKDRRFFVHEVTALPLLPKDYGPYWKWLRKQGGASRLMHYLLEDVDTSIHDPYGCAPMTAAKVDMAASGRSNAEDWAVMIVRSPDALSGHQYVFYRSLDLRKLFDPEDKEKLSMSAFSRALRQAGLFRVAGGNNNIVIEGERTRLWILRDVDKYRHMGPAEAQRLYLKEREDFKTSGNSKFSARRVLQ